ncbi:MAG: hypothetical protein R3F33_09365 [Planctomycetota bacterium]
MTAISFIARTTLAILLLASPSLAQYLGEITFEDTRVHEPTGHAWEQFGIAVAMSGEWAMVGYRYQDTGNLLSTGGVVIFQRQTTGWVETQRYVPTDVEAGDQVGTTLAMDGSTALVGSPSRGAGAVYVLQRVGTSWQEVQKIEGMEDDSYFGGALALEGDTLVASAVGEGRLGPQSGAVHVYRRTAGVWDLYEILLPAGVPAGLPAPWFFGASVALSGNTIAAGMRTGSYTGWPPVYFSEQVFLYELSGPSWQQSALLVNPLVQTPGDPGSSFGWSIALDGDRLAIGAPRYVPDDGPDSAVCLYQRTAPGAWALQQVIRPSQSIPAAPGGTDGFGTRVVLKGETLLIGAPKAMRDPGDPERTGQAYVFTESAVGFVEEQVLQSSGPIEHEGELGSAVAMSGHYVLVSDSRGGFFPNSLGGAAYFFERNLGTPYCNAQANSTGNVPELRVTGSLQASDETLSLRARDLPPGQPGLALLARAQGYTAHPGGSVGDLCIGGAMARAGVAMADAEGRLFLPLDPSAVPLNPAVAIQAGETWFFQLWYRDLPAGTSNLTRAVQVDFE